jgi:hypothetical protein
MGKGLLSVIGRRAQIPFFGKPSGQNAADHFFIINN